MDARLLAFNNRSRVPSTSASRERDGWRRDTLRRWKLERPSNSVWILPWLLFLVIPCYAIPFARTQTMKLFDENWNQPAIVFCFLIRLIEITRRRKIVGEKGEHQHFSSGLKNLAKLLNEIMSSGIPRAIYFNHVIIARNVPFPGTFLPNFPGQTIGEPFCPV